MKKCSECGQMRDETEFYQKPKRNVCKVCVRAKRAEYRKANPEKVRESKKLAKANHPETTRERGRRWRQNNSEKVREIERNHYAANKEAILAKKRERYQERADALRARERELTPRHRDQKRDYVRKRLADDPVFRLKYALRRRIALAIKKGDGVKSKKTTELIGCSVEQLRAHLEARFDGAMSWENYGSYWHIDHIIPCAAFDLSREDEQRRCFHWTNLQPLEARKNIQKGASLPTGPARHAGLHAAGSERETGGGHE